MNLIQVYAPTMESTEAGIENYEMPKQSVKDLKKEELIIFMGDFNSKVGRSEENDLVSTFELGT